MATKNLYYKVAPPIYTAVGVELAAGDEATIFLNQARIPDLPASINAIVQVVEVYNFTPPSGSCVVEGRRYLLSYDSDDLGDMITELAECDVVAVAGTACCNALRDALDEEVAAREALDADLQTWDVQTFSGPLTNGSPGVPQVETQTAVGTITGDGTLLITVTGAGITGSPLAIPFNVEAGDTPSVWAAKAAAAMANNAAVSALYLAGNIAADFALTEKVPNGNDGTLNIALNIGTATGATLDISSSNTVFGVAAVVPSPVPARIGQLGRWGNRVWVALDLYTWTEQVTEWNGIVDYGFTGFTGGGATNLDSTVVNSTLAGHLTLVNTGNAILFYELVSGTDADDFPLVVRPSNYNGATNAYVWKLRPAETKSSAVLDATVGGQDNADAGKVVLYAPGGGILISDQLNIQKAGQIYGSSIGTTNITASRAHETPDASGTLHLQSVGVNTSPLTGATITATTYVDQSHYITPAGTIAALTFTLPTAANSRVGQKVRLWFTQIVTALTVNVSGGGTILGTALTAAVVNTPYEYECVLTSGTGTWVRRQ